MLSKRRLTVLEKLALYGADTEKKISLLNAEDIYNVILTQGLRMSDMREILDLQKAIKEKKIIPYFTNGTDKEVKPIESSTDFGADDGGDDQEVSSGYTGWHSNQY